MSKAKEKATAFWSSKAKKCEFRSFEGQWKNDVAEGHGIEFIQNGDYYEGMFQKGKRQGNGILHFADGSIFTGEFVSGKINGYGRLIRRNHIEELHLQGKLEGQHEARNG